MRAFFVLTPLFVFLGATYASNSIIAQVPNPTTPSVQATPTRLYGEALPSTAPLPLLKVLSAPNSYKGQTVLVTGSVRQVCTKKGCWMELAPTGQEKKQGCRVTFKNYGFFVPVDSAGALARLEGKVEIKKVDPAAVAHYEAEGASFAHKAADGSAHEVRIVATGVELTRGVPKKQASAKTAP